MCSLFKGAKQMKDEIQKIREMLDVIEQNDESNSNETFKESFNLFELPSIIGDIVDLLQPLLLPYEAASYWYMFRHSILKNGDVYVRVSVRGMAKNIITSSSGQSESLSYSSVQNALTGLENKEVIKKVGDTNREGTLYQIFLPEEIKICQERMVEKQVESLPIVDPKKELDYYNIPDNRIKIFERDGYKCKYCEKQLTRFSATLDHIQPVSEGGDNSYNNLMTSCLHCNSRRGSRPVMDIITKNI
jgi:hypothetical protein